MSLTFAASLVAATMALPRLPLGPESSRRLQTIPPFDVPRDAFFVETAGDDLSQLVLWHALGDSIDNARRADVLFVGDSRMPVGLREEVIVPAAEALGLRAFSLACGHVERVPFALELIRKHDLRPKVVVVVGGPHVFKDLWSDPATKATTQTRWQAWTQWLEADARWELQRLVHGWLPRVDWFGNDLRSPWILYRSSRTGWMLPVVEPSAQYPIGLAPEDATDEWQLPVARELADELDRRGAQLVLSIVPYGRTRTGHLPFLSEALGVPTVLPSFDGMHTADGSHLDRSSADAYAKDFWSKLVALPEVRRKLALDDPPVSRP